MLHQVSVQAAAPQFQYTEVAGIEIEAFLTASRGLHVQ